jgi:hypothetical protein
MMPSTAPLPTATLEPTSTPVPVPTESIMSWEVASTSSQIIYDQGQRAALGGGDPYFFWPDGNISFIPQGDQYLFFGPNSSRTARMLGTFDNPGAKLEAGKISIEGVPDDFPFASSGAIYQDPASGMLLMFYHAERYPPGNRDKFHAAIGLAVSNDQGDSFQNLGIILETNSPPNWDAPCCADIGGATFTVKDGQFYVYFRDRMVNLDEIQLALATAPVAEVLQAARNGTTSPWHKNFYGAQEPGISGRSSPLEDGNQFTNWFSVSYNKYLNKFLMAVSYHPGEDLYDSGLYLISSDDGYTWTPRVPLLTHCNCELTYPTIIDPGGDPLNTDKAFYIYYVTTPRDVTRWRDTALQRMTVKLTGQMVQIPTAWEFEKDGDAEGWAAANQIGHYEVTDGALIFKSIGSDPFINSPSLNFSATTYTKIEIRMKVGQAGTGQLFFTSTLAQGISEQSTVRFPVSASEDFKTYTTVMSTMDLWSGRIQTLRFDPIDQITEVEIDYVRLLP